MIEQAISKGTIIHSGGELRIADIDWASHPSFQGVHLKHIITSQLTEGKFSRHLVRIESGCEIGEHVHSDKWELHEILKGVGKAFLSDQEVSYVPGTSIVIPEGERHSVIAGREDLYLLTTFVPALV